MTGMYKTVRQGDASLHYTILPQIDESHVHDSSSVRGSPPFECHHCEVEDDEDDIFLQPSPPVVCCMGIVLVIIISITCCIITTYLLDALMSSPYAVTTSQTTDSVTGEILMPKDDILAEDEREHDTISPSTTSSGGFDVPSMLTDDRVLDSSSRSSTVSPSSLDDEPANLELAITETIPPSTGKEPSASHPSRTGRTPATVTSSLDLDAEPSDSPASMTETTTNNIVNKIRKPKMPRVTSKLRTNETVPQMNMKAGIAYKKGNITIVLAQGLSLEGFVFKTPEGTIKPWKDMWPFEGTVDILRVKCHRVFWPDIVRLSAMLLTLGTLVMTVFRLEGGTIHRIHNIEEGENQDGPQTILTDGQIQEINDIKYSLVL